jgi:hypothetical protein
VNKVIREDTSDSVVGIITGITLSSGIVCITRSECTGFKCKLSITANRRDLLGKLKLNGLVNIGSIGRGRILCGTDISQLYLQRYKKRKTYLMLRNRSNLRVHRRKACAGRRSKTDRAGVAFQSAINEGANHAVNIISGLGVRERLVGRRGLETVKVGNGACAGSGSCVSEQTEHRIFNPRWVVCVERGTDGSQELVV